MDNTIEGMRQQYLERAYRTTVNEEAYRNVLMELMPDSIIDCHVRNNLPEHVSGLDSEIRGHMASTLPAYTIEESLAVTRMLYGSKHIRRLRFAHAYRGIDHKAANAYLKSNCPMHDRIALYGYPDGR